MEHGIIKKFHDQKEPDFDPENGVVYDSGSEGQKRYMQFKEMEKRNENIGTQEAVYNIIKEAINQINDIKLEDFVKDDPEQIKLLMEKKDLAKRMIEETNFKIIEYVDAIKTRIDKQDYTDGNKDLTEIKMLDQAQSIKHNALIDTIKKTIRFISHTFGDISEEAIEEWNENLESRGTKILFPKRVKFNEKIICPENINLNDRHQIADWAIHLYSALTKIKK